MFERLKDVHPIFKGVPLVGIILVSALVGYLVGSFTAPKIPKEGTLTIDEADTRHRNYEDVDFSLFWEVWDIAKKGYYKQPVNDLDLFYGAMEGLVQGLGDPYSVFLSPESAGEFSDELSGNFQGIGTEIGTRDGLLIIVAPLPETPAEKAGLKAGDVIFAIDGMDTLSMSIDEAVRHIRGEKGTKVVLTVISQNDENLKDIEVTRDEIHVKSVEAEYDEESNTFLISINNFNTDTVSLFREAALKALTVNPAGIILDLRNNPGGFLDSSVKVAGYWTGDMVVVKERGSGTIEETYVAGSDPILADIKTVVLINGGSASASEIVAGALKDHEFATIVGEQSFGKGTVQVLEDLRGGSAIKYTVSEWLTPNGNSIDEDGVTPDVIVEFTEEDYINELDPQLEAARALF